MAGYPGAQPPPPPPPPPSVVQMKADDINRARKAKADAKAARKLAREQRRGRR